MPRKKTPTTEVAKAPPGFQPGHPRYAGRQKRTAAQARALADQLGIDPLDYMLRLLTVDVVEEVEIATDGTERKIKVPVSHETKIEICKALANFFYPRLNAQTISGPNDGPLEVATLDLSKIMSDPMLVEQAQNIALALVEAGTQAPGQAQICASPDESSAQPARDMLSDLAKDNKGHWAK